MPKRPRWVATLSLAAAAIVAVPALGERYALVVGVEGYHHDALRGANQIEYAVDDARDFSGLLRDAGYNVELLLDREATKEAIERKVREVRTAARDRDDAVLFAFAGHGLQVAGQKEAYFCPVDAVPLPGEYATLVSVHGLVFPELEKSLAGTKLILVDACRNDPGRSRGLSRGIVPGAAGPPPRGIGVVYSCSPGQRAWEDPELGHGVFFHYVLESLGRSGGEPVSMFGLLDRVVTPVSAHARGLSSVNQVPMVEWLGAGSPLILPPRDVLRAGEERSDNALSMPLVWCPPTGPGGFLMGSPDADKDAQIDEKPPHRVVLSKGFWLGRHEVTQGEWEEVMGTRPWEGKTDVLDSPRAAATYVSWEAAVAFSERLTESERRAGRLPADERYTLPSEAQWEYACRGGTTTRWSFGDDESHLGDYAWWGGVVGDGNAKDQRYAHEVETKRPNSWGLFDMHGNVWEWCADWYWEKYYETGRRTDPLGPPNGENRVLRGGAWFGWPADSRSASRISDAPGYQIFSVGFRVARTK